MGAGNLILWCLSWSGNDEAALEGGWDRDSLHGLGMKKAMRRRLSSSAHERCMLTDGGNRSGQTGWARYTHSLYPEGRILTIGTHRKFDGLLASSFSLPFCAARMPLLFKAQLRYSGSWHPLFCMPTALCLRYF